jgi:glycosyltransferase involved in cell wall biosynthesis
MGGRNYLLNLLSVLTRYESGRVTPVLFLGEDENPSEWQEFSNLIDLEIVRGAPFNTERRAAGLAQAVLFGKHGAAAALFRRHHVDVVFESARYFGWRLGVPAIAWIPDFQHRELPDLFARSARLKRELGFRAQIASGRHIMLSSDDARRACIRLYPESVNRAHTVHFAILPPPVMPLERARALTRKVGLDEPFFFLPNQFWRHKNHGLVVEAMALLQQRGKRIVVFASGQRSDPRDPAYFPALQARISQLGLAQKLLLPGLVPYEQVSALLRTCSALINPSLFEGWSTSVEEARLMGTPMLLSDLDVHREQMGQEARYFDRHSPSALAECLEKFIPLDDTARALSFTRAQSLAETRARNFGGEFTDLVLRCAPVKRA